MQAECGGNLAVADYVIAARVHRLRRAPGTRLVKVMRVTIEQPSKTAIPRTIGELCFGGDWACAHGDVETLGYIAFQLAERAHEPLHCELVALADTCRCDPDRATAAWVRLRELVQQSIERPSP